MRPPDDCTGFSYGCVEFCAETENLIPRGMISWYR
jgi:hypothetical protein